MNLIYWLFSANFEKNAQKCKLLFANKMAASLAPDTYIASLSGVASCAKPKDKPKTTAKAKFLIEILSALKNSENPVNSENSGSDNNNLVKFVYSFMRLRNDIANRNAIRTPMDKIQI